MVRVQFIAPAVEVAGFGGGVCVRGVMVTSVFVLFKQVNRALTPHQHPTHTAILISATFIVLNI